MTEKRVVMCQFPDKDNAEFYMDKEIAKLLKEGLVITERSLAEINYKWVVRIMAVTPQGEFDFDN